MVGSYGHFRHLWVVVWELLLYFECVDDEVDGVDDGGDCDPEKRDQLGRNVACRGRRASV